MHVKCFFMKLQLNLDSPREIISSFTLWINPRNCLHPPTKTARTRLPVALPQWSSLRFPLVALNFFQLFISCILRGGLRSLYFRKSGWDFILWMGPQVELPAQKRDAWELYCYAQRTLATSRVRWQSMVHFLLCLSYSRNVQFHRSRLTLQSKMSCSTLFVASMLACCGFGLGR